MRSRKLPGSWHFVLGIGGVTVLVACALAWFFLVSKPAPSSQIVVPRDYPTIQAALDQVAGGSTIVVQARGGPYEGPIHVDASNVTIISSGGRAKIVCPTGEPAVTIHATGIELRGFRIEADGIGVQLLHSVNASLDDLVIEGARVGIQASESNDSVITSIVIGGCKTGIEMMNANRNRLQQIRIGKDAAVGVRLSSAWSNTIEDISVDGVGVGVSIEDDSQENEIATLTAISCSEIGLEILSSSSNLITGGRFTDCATGILLNTASNNRIEHNSIKRSAKYAISLYKSPQNAISENSVQDGLRDGISLSACQDNSITHNFVSTCQGTALTLEGVKSSLILANDLEKNAIGLQILEGARNRVLRNSLKENALAGIVLSAGSRNLLLDNVTAGSAYAVALIGASDNQLLRNSMTNSSEQGLCLLNHADKNHIQDNTLKDNKVGVLIASSSQTALLDNRISHSEIALRLFESGTDTRLEGNIISCNSTGLEISSKLDKQETILRGSDSELLAGAEQGFSLTLAKNSFSSNKRYDISNSSDRTIYAEGNYWNGAEEEDPSRIVGQVVLPRSSWKASVALGATSSLDQVMIARLLQLGLTSEGMRVIDLIGLESEEQVKDALIAGDIDVAVGKADLYDVKELSDTGISTSALLPAEDTLLLVVSPEIATHLSGTTISDLAIYLTGDQRSVKLAVEREIPHASVAALASTYGITLEEDNVVWTNGIDESETALKLGTVDAAIVHSLQEAVTIVGYQALNDDQGALTARQITFFTRQSVIDAHPGVRAIEEELRPLLTSDNVHSLVSRVRLLHSDPAAAARQFMVQQGLMAQ
ncbi:MAG TPA: hypothetical protein ENF88_02920 [Candidatus Acetothermia bacterium]|nr:hypothetical protein [Candidatus Acetothermia bacterium]HEX32629.1 hypothetical protein [Candidatus Acetothermia bacterium]